MRKSWASCALALAFCATSVFAQGNGGGKPTTPPGQAPAAPAPQYVYDANGLVVGEVVSHDSLMNAVVRYEVAGGGYGAVQVTSSGITPVGQTGTMPRPGMNADQAQVMFTTANCTGAAYVFDSAPVPRTMTSKHLLVIPDLRFGPDPAPSGSCLLMQSSQRWLYQTDATECFRADFLEPPVTFHSYYGYNPADNSMCVPISPYTVPNPAHWGGAYRIYQPVEDLEARFKAPFRIE